MKWGYFVELFQLGYLCCLFSLILDYFWARISAHYMFRVVLLFTGILASFCLHAQTGIGTIAPNAAAKLDVSSANKGFLPPRVALTALTDFAPVTGLSGSNALATAAGLLVYNTTSNANVVPGYYYWNGTSWVQIAGGLILENKTAGFTLSASDNNKLFLINAVAIVTVPTLPIGFSCQFIQTGGGIITLQGESGITLNSANGLRSRSTNSAIGIVMNSTTTGYVFGDTMY